MGAPQISLFLRGQENGEEDIKSWSQRTFFPLSGLQTHLLDVPTKCLVTGLIPASPPLCFFFFLIVHSLQNLLLQIQPILDLSQQENDPAQQERRLQTLFGIVPNYSLFSKETSSA